MNNQGKERMKKKSAEKFVAFRIEEIRGLISVGTFKTLERDELNKETQILGSRFVDKTKNAGMSR